MRQLHSYATISFFLLVASTFLNGNSLVDFKDISLDEALIQEKKIFISFSAPWCMPCKMMNETIYNDREIADFLNDNFVNIKADIETTTGKHWKEHYNAHYLPTTVFVSESGEEIDRIVGVPSQSQFLDMLYIMAEVDKRVTTGPSPKPIAAAYQPPQKNLQVSSYALQIGAYAKVDNAQRMISKLNESSYYNSSIRQYNQDNGGTLYRVLLSGYESRSEAHEELYKIKEEGFEGFVRKI